MNAYISVASALSGEYGDLLTTMARLMAYIVPFFLIPATFKVGMGIFGNLAGMVNDRGRGVFDRQKKYRANTRAREFAKAKAGERFNNRGLNALTSRATTRNLGLGAKGSAAYQQKMNNAGAEFGKSSEAAGVMHNDNALRALTYGSEAQARANMRRDFNMSEADINSSIAAAKASGGFGRNRQVWAAQQLAATGTGYDDLRQVAQTVARASHGNASQAAALAGNISAATKSAGRFDLAPGFGQLNGLAQAEMSGGGANDAAYHRATVAAARGVDSVSLLRGKPAQVRQLTQALADHADANRRIMNSSDPGVTQAQKDTARDEFLQTMGQIDQLSQSKSYASQENQEIVNTLLNDTQHLRTQELDKTLGRTYDSAGNRTDLHTVTDPATGRTVTLPIPGSGVTQQQIDARERYSQTKAPRGYDPNDPNNQA